MLILPGKLHMKDWVIKTNLADDILLAVSETGYSNDVIALDLLSHFDRFSSRSHIGAYWLRLIDGHTVRHSKHPRRNHYSDEALLAIHTVVAHYHTKERALAPAM